jgi:tetratricopeptide (TPR) repeat protein
MRLAEIESSLQKVSLDDLSEGQSQYAEDMVSTVKQIEEPSVLDSSRKLLLELLSRARDEDIFKASGEMQSDQKQINFGNLIEQSDAIAVEPISEVHVLAPFERKPEKQSDRKMIAELDMMIEGTDQIHTSPAYHSGLSFFIPFHELDPLRQRQCIFFTKKGSRCRWRCLKNDNRQAIAIHKAILRTSERIISLNLLQEYALCNCCSIHHQARIEEMGLLTPLARRWQDEIWRHPVDQSNVNEGLLADLEEAIQLGRQAIEATPEDHPDGAAYLDSLGNRLIEKYTTTGAAADLEEAIQLGRQAIEATPEDHPDRAVYLDSLRNRLIEKYATTGAAADLEEAIQLRRQAAQLQPQVLRGQGMYDAAKEVQNVADIKWQVTSRVSRLLFEN